MPTKEELYAVGQGLGDSVWTNAISSIQSMTARDCCFFGHGVVVGAGGLVVVVGISTRGSVADIFNEVVSRIPGNEAFRRNRIAPAFEPLTLNPTSIEDLENIYFHGIDHKAGLTKKQIQQLKEFLEHKQIRGLKNNPKGNVEENVEKLTACTTLEDILHLLSDLKLVLPKSYRKIETILQNSNIGVNVASLSFNVGGLINAVSDIEKKLSPRGYEHDKFELDVLIMHSADDNEAVVAFKNDLSIDSGIPGLSVQAYEEFDCGNGKVSALGDIYTRTRYIFVFVTKNLQGDKMKAFNTESALVDSLEDNNNNYRIIPVLTTNEKLRMPGMDALIGLNYWKRDTLYINKLKKTLKDGREKFVNAL